MRFGIGTDVVSGEYYLNISLHRLLYLVLFAVLFWLKSYTNHGQKIQLANYANMPFESAKSEAARQSFELIVNDSTHIVGRPGGIVLDQNPSPGSMVKEKRKVYVTTTKYNPDQIKVKDLPLLYGTDYDQAVADLKSRSLFAEIKAKKYDAGQPNHILEVWYKGNKIIDGDNIKQSISIEKGAILEFVISDRKGGLFLVPDLACKKLADAQSYMLYSKLSIGEIIEDGDIADPKNSWIVSQTPQSDGLRELPEGSKLHVTISATKPSKCNN